MVSGEFATGNELASATAPMMLNLFPAGANLTSTGEVILWGYVCNPMMLLRRGSGTEAMVATLKRPPPGAPPPPVTRRLCQILPGAGHAQSPVPHPLDRPEQVGQLQHFLRIPPHGQNLQTVVVIQVDVLG